MKTINAYTFPELSDTAKEKVRSSFHDDDQEFVYDDAKATLNAFIKVIYDTCGIGVHYDGYHIRIAFKEPTMERMQGSRLMRYLLKNVLPYRPCGKYSCGHSIAEYEYCPLTGMTYDHTVLAPIILFTTNPTKYTKHFYTNWNLVAFEDLLRDSVHGLEKKIEEDLEYPLTDEYLEEVTSDYYFDSNGNIIEEL